MFDGEFDTVRSSVMNYSSCPHGLGGTTTTTFELNSAVYRLCISEWQQRKQTVPYHRTLTLHTNIQQIKRIFSFQFLSDSPIATISAESVSFVPASVRTLHSYCAQRCAVTSSLDLSQSKWYHDVHGITTCVVREVRSHG